MKKAILYEIIAAVLMTLGAVVLVCVYWTILDPILYRLDSHQWRTPVSRYVIGTPISLLILSASWYFNRKAQKLKRDEKDGEHEQKPSA
ncbi:MAG TPA: hypothetical protein VIK53_19510 [Verrucomicrobiae bacterium]